MAQRGRPRGGDSAETRKRILEAARDEFARCGFDGASVATIAANADLAPSAVYHYFGGKSALYEEVFDASVEAVWDDVSTAASQYDTLLRNVEALVRFINEMGHESRAYSDFLALVPMETSLHPEFGYMLKRRTKWQDSTFGALAELGIKTGELRGFDVVTARDMLRSLIMGWFFEAYFRSSPQIRSGDAVVTVIRLLADRPRTAI